MQIDNNKKNKQPKVFTGSSSSGAYVNETNAFNKITEIPAR